MDSTDPKAYKSAKNRKSKICTTTKVSHTYIAWRGIRKIALNEISNIFRHLPWKGIGICVSLVGIEPTIFRLTLESSIRNIHIHVNSYFNASQIHSRTLSQSVSLSLLDNLNPCWFFTKSERHHFKNYQNLFRIFKIHKTARNRNLEIFTKTMLSLFM